MSTSNTNSPSPLQGKPEIIYPCTWQYKIIGQDKNGMKQVIREICHPLPVTVNYSHSSSSGKYHSFNAEIEVADEDTRMTIYQALQNHPLIKVVL